MAFEGLIEFNKYIKLYGWQETIMLCFPSWYYNLFIVLLLLLLFLCIVSLYLYCRYYFILHVSIYIIEQEKNALFAKVFISFIVCLAYIYILLYTITIYIECLYLAYVYSNNIIVRFSTAQQMNIMYTCLLFPCNIKEH